MFYARKVKTKYRNTVKRLADQCGYCSRTGTLNSYLVRGVLGGGIVKVTSILLQLSVSILLARLLGAEGLGVYSFALAIVVVLAIPVQFGFPGFVVRKSAIYFNRREFASLKGLLYTVNVFVVLAAVIVSVLCVSLVRLFVSESHDPYIEPLVWAFAMLPFVVLCAVSSGVVRGLGYVTRAEMVDQLVRPAAFLFLVGAAIGTNLDVDETLAIQFVVFAAFAASLVAFSVMFGSLPDELVNASAEFELRRWFLGSLPFVILGGTQVMMQQIDVIMLGALAEARDVGVYSVCGRIASLVTFGLIVINPVIGPQLARLHDTGERVRLQRVVSFTVRGSVLIATPLAVLLLIGGGWLLGAVYGNAFKAGHIALSILVLGQLFNVAMGSVKQILNMTGHAWYSAAGLGVATVVNLVLNIILIPRYGIEGAAWATILSLCSWNMLLAYWVHKFTGLNSTYFGARLA